MQVSLSCIAGLTDPDAYAIASGSSTPLVLLPPLSPCVPGIGGFCLQVALDCSGMSLDWDRIVFGPHLNKLSTLLMCDGVGVFEGERGAEAEAWRHCHTYIWLWVGGLACRRTGVLVGGSGEGAGGGGRTFAVCRAACSAAAVWSYRRTASPC